MPWNLFEVFKEKGIDYKYLLPDSLLFRYEGDFVPWYDDIRANVKDDFKIYSSGHFSPRFGHVAINRAYLDQTYGRCAGNMYEDRRYSITSTAMPSTGREGGNTRKGWLPSLTSRSQVRGYRVVQNKGPV